MSSTAEHCVDGRSTQGIIGTPGGNMGEFILMLAAAETVTGSKIRSAEIFPILEKYLKLSGAFYMHTDTHGLKNLKKELKSNPLFAKYKNVSIKQIEKLIRKPAKKYQASLVEYLIQPQNIGCGHLKLVLLNPQEYTIRPELIKTCIRAFYNKLWSNNKNLEFVVLDEDHKEGAVVIVLVDSKKITPQTLIPTVSSMGKDHQMFIAHPQAESYMRQTIVSQAIKHKLIPGIKSHNKTKLLNTINQTGGLVTRLTLSHLALGLPHYTVTLKK